MLPEIIEHFGGRIALADALGVDPAAVTNWHRRGVPLKQAVKIETLSDGKFSARKMCPTEYGVEPPTGAAA